jgi:hypothetical protein
MCKSKLQRVWDSIAEIGKAGWIITSVVLIVGLIGLTFNIASYRIQSRNDHASLYSPRPPTMSSPAADQTLWSQQIQNSGVEDATTVTFKLGTIDPNTRKMKLLNRDEWVKVPARGGAVLVEFLIQKKDFLGLFITCLTYSDKRDYRPEEISFYQWPTVPQSNMGAAAMEVAPSEHEKLSAGLSCDKLR